MHRLVVVGASLAGLRAVESARRAGFDGEITLIGAEEHLPYDRPPLSKDFLAAAAAPAYFRTADSLRDELGVRALLGEPATALRADERVVVAAGREVPYTALVIATGASARTLPGPPGVHSLRTVADAAAIRAALDSGARTVVVGCGFIGSEVACAARRRALPVTVVEAAPVPLARAVGDRMGAVCANLLTGHGIDLRCGVAVDGFGGTDRVESVRLSDGTVLPADLVVVGIGAAPTTDWLEDSGLKLADGVVCDETLNAGAPGVYAAGDVARWHNPLFGELMRLEHWTTAAEQGALAARNALDPAAARPCATVPYFWSDWLDDRLQFVGVPDADDVAIVEGDPDSDFLALYRRAGRVVGALGRNQRKAIMRLRRQIGS